MRGGLPGLAIFLYLLSGTVSGQNARKLSAPTYYIAVSATFDYGNVVRVRGASNLPPGSRIALQVFAMPDLSKPESDKLCTTVSKDGLFHDELAENASTRDGLILTADFATNSCKQPDGVLQVVGKHGEHLGNDQHVTLDEVEMGETPGMIQNPQLYQSSGWYFGLSTITLL